MRENTILRINLSDREHFSAYLFKSGDDIVLIDPGAPAFVKRLLKQIETHTPLTSITHVVVQNMIFNDLSVLKQLESEGLRATLITYATESIESAGIEWPVYGIADFNYVWTLSNGESLMFYESSFVPCAHSFMTYIPSKHALFSGVLFSHNPRYNDNLEALSKSVKRTHETLIPSSEFVVAMLKKVAEHPLKRVYPIKGDVIDDDWLDTVREHVIKHDFYNASEVLLAKQSQRRRFNYIGLSNLMLKQLHKHFDAETIKEAFTDDTIILKQNESILEVNQSSLEGYKLWNRFFDNIYHTHGVNWLALLEPLVRKYARMYNVRLPKIYRSQIVKQQIQSHTHKEQSDALKTELENVNRKLKSTIDQLLRDPVTDIYNETFMRQHLRNELTHALQTENTRGLLFIEIDQLSDFNQRYGKTTGDESLRNAVYEIEHAGQDHLVFKQHGPALIVYDPACSQASLRDRAETILERTENSTLFVEPITVSIGVVTLKEIDADLTIEGKINRMVDYGLMRLMLAKRRGGGQYIDASNATDSLYKGSVLIIDEDEINQNLLLNILSRASFDAVIANDIYEAYDILSTHRIDVIISEINLSKLDGYQFKTWVNNHPTFHHIPFIIASHHKNRDVIRRSNQLGVDIVLKKPIIPEEIIGLIERYRQRRIHYG